MLRGDVLRKRGRVALPRCDVGRLPDERGFIQSMKLTTAAMAGLGLLLTSA